MASLDWVSPTVDCVIINLRGTNGSGKSTVARAFPGEGVTLAPFSTPKGKLRHVVGNYSKEFDLIVVGPYRTECGGCDAIGTQDQVCESVASAAGLAEHVLFEGVIVSTLFERYRKLSLRLGGMVWAYLDTPVELCLARIAARNGGKPIKEELVRDKVRSIESTRRKALAAGERVEIVDHTRAIEVVKGWL